MTHEQPDEALRLYQKANAMADQDLSSRTFRATLPHFPKSLRQEATRWKAVHDWLHKRGVIKRKIPLQHLFTNKFVPPTPRP